MTDIIKESVLCLPQLFIYAWERKGCVFFTDAWKEEVCSPWVSFSCFHVEERAGVLPLPWLFMYALIRKLICVLPDSASNLHIQEKGTWKKGKDVFSLSQLFKCVFEDEQVVFSLPYFKCMNIQEKGGVLSQRFLFMYAGEWEGKCVLPAFAVQISKWKRPKVCSIYLAFLMLELKENVVCFDFGFHMSTLKDIKRFYLPWLFIFALRRERGVLSLPGFLCENVKERRCALPA